MSTVTILAKQPPGGRCSLYLRYAQALNQAHGLATEVRYGDEGAPAAAPAMLIGDRLIMPADGVIVSPEDIAISFSDRFREDEITELRRLLEVTQEQWMEEMSQA